MATAADLQVTSSSNGLTSAVLRNDEGAKDELVFPAADVHNHERPSSASIIKDNVVDPIEGQTGRQPKEPVHQKKISSSKEIHQTAVTQNFMKHQLESASHQRTPQLEVQLREKRERERLREREYKPHAMMLLSSCCRVNAPAKTHQFTKM